MGIVYKIFEERIVRDRSGGLRWSSSPKGRRWPIASQEAVARSLDNTLEEQLELEARLQSKAGFSRDFAEGIAAFREKRTPRFETGNVSANDSASEGTGSGHVAHELASARARHASGRDRAHHVERPGPGWPARPDAARCGVHRRSPGYGPPRPCGRIGRVHRLSRHDSSMSRAPRLLRACRRPSRSSRAIRLDVSQRLPPIAWTSA